MQLRRMIIGGLFLMCGVLQATIIDTPFSGLTVNSLTFSTDPTFGTSQQGATHQDYFDVLSTSSIVLSQNNTLMLPICNLPWLCDASVGAEWDFVGGYFKHQFGWISTYNGSQPGFGSSDPFGADTNGIFAREVLTLEPGRYYTNVGLSVVNPYEVVGPTTSHIQVDLMLISGSVSDSSTTTPEPGDLVLMSSGVVSLWVVRQSARRSRETR